MTDIVTTEHKDRIERGRVSLILEEGGDRFPALTEQAVREGWAVETFRNEYWKAVRREFEKQNPGA